MFRVDESGKDRAKQESEAEVTIDEGSVVIVEQSVNPYLVLFHDPTGYRAEQIRGLRNKLVAMNPDGAAKTLVVTSAIRDEGKSVTAINLAMAFAERERTPVILVDADTRFPTAERYLHLNPAPGLSDVLLGHTSLEQAVRPSGVRNMAILGAGSRIARPSELLIGNRIEELYARLKERYQYVVIDTPPAVPATDASMLSASADGTLFVIRLEHSSRSLARDAVRNLRDLGANVLGVFVTEVRGSTPENDARLTYNPRSEQA
jgi:receptor protein-tyrosine kinase